MMLGFCFLSDESQLASTVIELTGTIYEVGVAIGVGFFLITLGWTYLMRVVRGDGMFPYKAFMRYVVFFIILLLYQPIMALSSGVLCALANVLPDVSNTKEMMNLAYDSWYMNIGSAMLSDESPNFLFDFIKANILIFTRTVLEFIKTILASLLMILGPLAIALDLLPYFNGVALKWFRNFATVLLWSLTMSILDHLVVGFSESFVNSADINSTAGFWYKAFMGDDISSGLYMATNFCFFIMYLSVPLITSWFAGTSTAGSAMSKMVGASVAAAAVTAKVGTAAATGGGSLLASGGGGGAKNAAAGAVTPQPQSTPTSTAASPPTQPTENL